MHTKRIFNKFLLVFQSTGLFALTFCIYWMLKQKPNLEVHYLNRFLLNEVKRKVETPWNSWKNIFIRNKETTTPAHTHTCNGCNISTHSAASQSIVKSTNELHELTHCQNKSNKSHTFRSRVQHWSSSWIAVASAKERVKFTPKPKFLTIQFWIRLDIVELTAAWRSMKLSSLLNSLFTAFDAAARERINSNAIQCYSLMLRPHSQRGERCM